MKIVFIISFFVVIFILGFWRGMAARSKRENIFYIGSMIISLIVLLAYRDI